MRRLGVGRVASFILVLVLSLPALPAWAQLDLFPTHADCLIRASFSRFNAAVLQHNPGSQGAPDLALSSRTQLPWWRTLKFYIALALTAVALTFGEWRWVIAREKQLRRMVRERTRELELEKVELLRAKTALVQLASHDGLMGIYNRMAIFDVLEQEIARAGRERTPLAIVLADLDKFKQINDTFGHLIGDQVLREFARRVRKHLRISDHVGRYGGEELLILMPGMRDESVARIAALHRQLVQEPFIFGDLVLRVTCSFGVSWVDGGEGKLGAFGSSESIDSFDSIDSLDSVDRLQDAVKSLLDFADKALYAAKRNGRNRVETAEFLSGSNARKRGRCVRAAV